MPLPTTFAGDASRAEGQWTKISSGPAPIGGPYYMSASRASNNSPAGYTVAVKVDSSGNVYEYGQTVDNSNSQRYAFLRKYDISGNVLWTKIFYSTSTGLSSSSVLVDATAGNSMVLDNLGYIWITLIDNTGSGSPCNVFKIDSAGNVLIGLTTATIQSTAGLAVDSSNNVYISGTSSTAFYLYKYSSTGSYINSIQGTSGTNNFSPDSKIVIDSSNNVYVAGHITNSSGYRSANICKYDSNLNPIWETYYNYSNSKFDGLSLAIDSSNNLVALVGPKDYGSTTGGSLIFTVFNINTLYNSSTSTYYANLLWGTSLAFSSSTNALANGIAINPITNNILVTGSQANPSDANAFWNWYINLSSSGTVLSSGSLAQVLDNTHALSGGPTYCTYDTSANAYLCGAVINPTSYTTSGGKVNFTYAYQDNFILKDSNPIQSTHAFSSVVFDSMNLKYTAGVLQPSYTAFTASFGISPNGIGVTGGGTLATPSNITNTYTGGVVTYNYYKATI
jgi:hypothetical protein